MVRRDEISSRVANDGTIQLLHSLDNVLAEAVFIRERIAWVIDAAVDAAAHVSRSVSISPHVQNIFFFSVAVGKRTCVLCETSIDIVVDLGHLVCWIDGDGRWFSVRNLAESRHGCSGTGNISK